MFSRVFQSFFKSPANCDFLTENSPLAGQPKHGIVPLWQHQLAMLQCCKDIEDYNLKIKIYPSNIEKYNHTHRPIEKEYGIGIMNDYPGSGKTRVVLALIAQDKTPSLNVIVVPLNLHHQWIEEIDKFLLPNTIECISIKNYADALGYNAKTKMEKTRLILTTSFLIEKIDFFKDYASMHTFMQDDQCINIDRIFIDEIDTSVKTFHNIPKCKRVWYISASFDLKLHRSIGPFNMNHLSELDIMRVICRCSDEFIKTSQPPLEEPLVEIIQVPDGDIELFQGDEEILRYLNTMNLKKAKRYLGLQSQWDIHTIKDLAIAAVDVYTKLENTSKSEIITNNLQKYTDDKFKHVTKFDEIIYVIKTMISIPVKWIIFSDDADIFDEVQKILEMYNIKSVNLTGGTVEKNEEALKLYKNDQNVKVLFLNSIKDGCGLCLENTTHILFLHNTDKDLIEQVIGRAQRYGRRSRLNITCLYHTNEMP